MNTPYGAYQQTNFQGESTGGQFALALEKAAQRVFKMRGDLENKDYESAYAAMSKATDLIVLLLGCVSRDLPEAAKMADTLENYYRMMVDLISQAYLKEDPALCDAAISSLQKMAATWRQVDQLVAQKSSEPATDTPTTALSA